MPTEEIVGQLEQRHFRWIAITHLINFRPGK